MSYRVLLVDDEPSAIETLKSLVNWAELGFALVGYAKDGREGLKKCRELHPDVVITDIQMPVMDGLDMIRNIRTIDANLLIVILSCHENFYYAKQSIQLGVNDYLIKDLLTQEELTWQLNNIRATLQKGKGDGAQALGLQVHLPEQIVRFHRARAMWESAFGGLLSPEEFAQMLPKVAGTKEQAPIVFMEVLLEGHPLERHQIIGALNLTLDSLWGGDVYSATEEQFSAVFRLDSILSQSKLLNDCNLICQKVRAALSKEEFIITIGLSHPFIGCEELQKYHEQAVEALRQRIFFGKKKNIFYHYTSGTSGSRGDQSINSSIAAIGKAMEGGTFSTVSQAITYLYSPLVNGYMKYNYIEEVNSRMFGLLMELLMKAGTTYTAFFGCDHIPFEAVAELDTVEEMADWFSEKLKALMDATHRETVNPYSRRVYDAITYIKEHFAEEMSLEVVSTHLNIHKAYLCRIFKQETGVNITDYIVMLRIEQAKKRMLTSDSKLYQIAEDVGFASPQQFNLYFKRLEGEPPAQWLKKQLPK